jgi:hypothetical protein
VSQPRGNALPLRQTASRGGSPSSFRRWCWSPWLWASCLSPVLVNPSPRPSGPSPAPGADSDEDSAELRALHSDYIEDMARNYANDFSDPSSEEDEAVRTHGLSPSEERKSVRLHHEDEAPCPRDRGSPTSTPCSTLKYIRALHPLELSRSSSSPSQSLPTEQ